MQGVEHKPAFKAALKMACLTALQQRINNARSAMEQAQESANNQEKSSAGDKYETARAMGQLDRDMNAAQLQQAQQEYRTLEDIDVQTEHQSIIKGSVFELDKQLFFAAVGLGPIRVNEQTVMVVSTGSPLFNSVKSKKLGDKVLFKNLEQPLTQVF